MKTSRNTAEALAEPDTPFDDGGPTRASASHLPHPVAALAQTHRPWLVRLLRLRFGRDAAEDLAQETFLRSAARYDPSTVRHPRAWLLAIAVNAARDDRRRRAVRPPLTDADGAAELTDTPASFDQEQVLLLKQVILSLPPKLRETFLLSRFEGLTYEEIARRLCISTKTVEWRMTRALAICTARLRD